MNEPWRLGVAASAAAYRAGTIKPSAMLDAVLARIEAINPTLNAFAHLDAPGAAPRPPPATPVSPPPPRSARWTACR